jgi:hypothetical protein
VDVDADDKAGLADQGRARFPQHLKESDKGILTDRFDFAFQSRGQRQINTGTHKKKSMLSITQPRISASKRHRNVVNSCRRLPLNGWILVAVIPLGYT